MSAEGLVSMSAIIVVFARETNIENDLDLLFYRKALTMAEKLTYLSDGEVGIFGVPADDLLPKSKRAIWRDVGHNVAW
eukprot:2056803-Ditylum_brightwellii.AAC.1